MSEPLWLVVGLGNPGSRYAGNRHNIGYRAVDAIARAHATAPWRKRFQGQTAEASIGGERVLLLRPETYMNDSGRSVAEAQQCFKIPIEDVTVFFDELDLAPAQGGFVELALTEPGRYPFVTHAMADAERGAHGILAVTR